MINKVYHYSSSDANNIGCSSHHFSNNKHTKLSFTPTSLTKTLNYNDIEIESPGFKKNSKNEKKEEDVFPLRKKRKSLEKPLDAFDKNFNEIIQSLIKYHPNKNKDKKRRKSLDIRKDNNSSLNLHNYIELNKEDIKSLSNTEEISDFYEYNEMCFSLLNQLIPVTKLPLPKISFPFFKDIPNKKLAIFDLDETLIHSEYKNIKSAQHIINVRIPSKNDVKIGINIRPHLKEALTEISKKYYIIVYTASDHSYANSVLNFIDPNNEFLSFRLYRNNCILAKVNSKPNLKIYIKDLNIFEGVDLKDMVIIDNSILSYAYHLNNGIPIMPYYSGDKDFELMFLVGYLEQIYLMDDLREANKKFIGLDTILKSKNEDNEISTEVTERNLNDDCCVNKSCFSLGLVNLKNNNKDNNKV